MKLFVKTIMAALVLATAITVFGVGMISSSNIALADHKPNHQQQGNPTNPATVTKEYCIDYRYYPNGPNGGFSRGHECVHSKDFCEQYVEQLSTRPEYVIDNGNCYKEITVVKNTPR